LALQPLLEVVPEHLEVERDAGNGNGRLSDHVGVVGARAVEANSQDSAILVEGHEIGIQIPGLGRDLDGDGRSDIAFDEGRQMWSYSSGGAGPLTSLREGDGQSVAYPELSRLLVGHFDGDPRAEVVSYYGLSADSGPVLTNHFMIWRGGPRDRFEQLSWHAMQ
jgi:hypothetical protein